MKAPLGVAISIGFIAAILVAGWFGYQVGLKKSEYTMDLYQYQETERPSAVLQGQVSQAPIVIVKSSSMFPCLSKGTGTQSVKVNASDLKVGDIISWAITQGSRMPGQGSFIIYNTHRVVRIANGCVYTKGDAVGLPDDRCLPVFNRTYDKVVAIYP